MSRAKRCSAASPDGYNMEPCTQAADIAVVKEQVANSRKEIVATRLMLEKMNKTLEHIAEQRIEIQHIKEDTARNERDINELFERIRFVELSPGRSAGKFFWMLVSVTVSGISGLIATVVTWLITQ